MGQCTSSPTKNIPIKSGKKKFQQDLPIETKPTYHNSPQQNAEENYDDEEDMFGEESKISKVYKKSNSKSSVITRKSKAVIKNNPEESSQANDFQCQSFTGEVIKQQSSDHENENENESFEFEFILQKPTAGPLIVPFINYDNYARNL